MKKPIPDLVEQVLDTWQRNATISDTLITAIPPGALAIAPYGPKARTLGQQLAHVHNVRCAWLRANSKELGRAVPTFPRGASPTKASLRAAFKNSAGAIEDLLREALLGNRRLKLFGGEPVLFLGYLIAHESHHRGQIATHLKQHGSPLSEKVALTGLWSAWGYSAWAALV